MTELVIKQIADIEPYSGPYALAGIRFRSARPALGVSAWGMNVVEFDAHCDNHPEHNHDKDHQEEVYVVLDGSIVLRVDGVEHVLSRGAMARVPASMTRKLITRESPAVVLALGGTPGAAYSISGL